MAENRSNGLAGVAPNTLSPLPFGSFEEKLEALLKTAIPPVMAAAAAGPAAETVTSNGSAVMAVCVGAGPGCAAFLVLFFLLLFSRETSCGGLHPIVKDSTPTAHQQYMLIRHQCY